MIAALVDALEPPVEQLFQGGLGTPGQTRRLLDQVSRVDAGVGQLPGAPQLTDDDMARIATLDTGASAFFDHRDPVMVTQLQERRGT